MTEPKQFHLHLVSDATGETLISIAHAAIVQFEDADPIEHTWALVRSVPQMEKVLAEIKDKPGLVMFTLVDKEIRRILINGCLDLGVPCVPVMDTVMAALSTFLGSKTVDRPGMQHVMNAEYFHRMNAMSYTLAHDDGQGVGNLASADIVLLGVSRTSKTPTSIYLANRGLKVANVPMVPEVPPPAELEDIGSIEDTDGPLVVALTTSPERLVQIRRNRLLALHEEKETSYIDLDIVREEVKKARKMFSARGWPVIDVTRRSIEETAAAILNLYNDYRPEGARRSDTATHGW
ncbi:MAG: kinase/pyrophosphorylase [Alphaproteobacteria bacterium]|nr:kinase/pyrophosphorylase [Rhodospirillaceae bacterium]MBT3703225.1 kinase/pyrophosphorylase [Alphaproteobacteria bacterium]MBT4018368.1 kinase/pyrophosphorylase [Alphaproteobacteria bacterium]MBT5158895.1 kinase/pyrophosphorylase [Alphaproteobacteria bacterium]MBT5919432.1 kinase/pyrophosphorylase [Alphaproteobacteria bacterium]